ncbi:MAG TPA: hypothetical protein VHF47_09320, partial [Acidimicrobiales bacterium]|nr:hypothetical protein [Acidimicrobiales bacterium]
MTEHDAVLNRLRALASAPVDDAVAQRHLSMFADVAAPVGPSRRSRVVVMGAVVAGTMLGSATLAGALTGNLPAPAQDVAHSALAKVGIEVPKAKGKAAKVDDTDGPGNVERFLGDATTPCTLPGGGAFVGNHGQYVKANPDDPATADVNERELAAQSPCGKPLDAIEQDAETAETETDDGGRKPAGTGRPEAPGKSTEHRPDDPGKPDADDT